MSLPTTSKPSQMSIRSFFQAKPPQYAPPPSNKQQQSLSTPQPPSPPPPPPPPQSQSPAPADSSPQSTIPPPPTQSPSTTTTSPTTTPKRNPRLPPEASIRAITPADITALRRLNSLLLPVSYPETFYSRAADPVTGRFSRLICWSHNASSSGQGDDGDDPKPVGGIVCRVEPDLPAQEGARPVQNIYIQSLCLLSPYRSLGLVSAALDDVLAAAVTDPALNVATVTAHVWTENEEGLHWYEARGFTKQGPAIKGYYLKLRPDSAWLVSKPVGASVLGALPSSASASSTAPSRPSSSRPDISGTTAAVMSLPPMPTAAQPPVRPSARVASGKSFQNQRPETEWNDLPADMAPSLLVPPKNGSEPGSGASSRSSSTVRRKKDRAYPAAAFGQ
ncbi:Pre-mRNA-splicing factor cwf24 [Trichoderma ghanense]|uniref:Pre-mRNA-splicing factor cwf24 n=1 Tax=Trichoderma ghanense TaxID=65468 RepID=A0ABY2GYS6_9HYPO